MALYKKALCYNWHYADAMYNLGVAYGEMLKFDMVGLRHMRAYIFTNTSARIIIRHITHGHIILY